MRDRPWISVATPTWYAHFPMYWGCGIGHLHVFRLAAWVCDLTYGRWR